jgi:hypothetical protein
MVSKHNNGTLNLWQLTFSEKSKFSQVLSISHASRASGHRFRVNDITCHPVLPLLLTTSHHNIPEITTPGSEASKMGEEGMTPLIKIKDLTSPSVSAILFYFYNSRFFPFFFLMICSMAILHASFQASNFYCVFIHYLNLKMH